jgi:hypothetical protein
MAARPGPLTQFPWEVLLGGLGKWLLVALPITIVAVTGNDYSDRYAAHMLGLALLSYVNAALWNFCRQSDAARIQTAEMQPIEFSQVDRENSWDEYIWLRGLYMLAFKALDSAAWCAMRNPRLRASEIRVGLGGLTREAEKAPAFKPLPRSS